YVRADHLVRVPLLHALVTQEPQGPRELRVGDGDHAALEGVHVLGGIEAEAAGDAEGTNWLPVQGGGVGLACGLDHGQVVPPRAIGELVHRGGVAVKVDWHDRDRARSYRGRRCLRVEAEAAGLDVDEDRLGADQTYGVRGGRERE